MKRFEKYKDTDGDISLIDIPNSELSTIIDKKFILDINMLESFNIDNFSYTVDNEQIIDEVLDLFKDDYEEIISIIPNPTVEGDEIGDDYLSWFLYGETKPLTTQEVLKIKQYCESLGKYSSPIRKINIINLVD